MRAGQAEGNFTVTVQVEDISASATVAIAREPAAPPPPPPPKPDGIKTLRWTGDVPPQKWMNFCTKVLSRFAASKGLKLTLTVEVTQEDGVSAQKIEETKVALREFGLNDEVEI